MPPRLVLALDQGTTNTKALVVDETGATVAHATRPTEIVFPAPGWVEQDAVALWRTAEEAIAQCLSHAPNRPIDALAITNQRESAVVWDRTTGLPAGPCIVWQCRRTASFCASLRDRGAGPLLERKTGLTIDPLFSASKIRWLLDHVKDGHARAAGGELRAGTVDSWMLWNLTRGRMHACDVTNASRTQLLNLQTASWDDELLALFGIPRAVLPEVTSSSGIVGETAGAAAIPAGIPIASLIGDSHAALFGHAAFRPGGVKATYGTGSSLMTRIARLRSSNAGLSTTVAWDAGRGPEYALEGNITVTGGAVDWMGRLLGDHVSAADVAALAERTPDSGGVHLVPAFAGLGAPHWDDEARGLISGLTRGTTAAELARATIESIAFQVRDVFDLMRTEAGTPIASLLTDGGASRNDTLMQFQADILGCPVARNRSADLSAVGAAWLAGLAVGLWKSFDDLDQLPQSIDRFEPRMSEAERERRYAGWVDAVDRSRSRPARQPVAGGER